MIKKILFSLGIIGLGIINFSSSYYDQSFVLDYSTEIQDNQGNNFEFKDYGNFLLNNQYKVFSIFATGTQNNKFLWNVFWNTDGYLYFIASCEGTSSPCSNTQNKSVNEFIKIQGKPQYFALCDDTNTINNQYGPCNPSQLDKNQASSFYSDTYSNPDELRVFGTDDLSQFNFCFHYDSLGKYVCFYVSYFWNLESSLGFTENPLYSQLGNSSLLNSVSCSPWGCPSGGGSSSGIGTGITLECTKQNALNRYNKNGYDRRLCYGGYDDFVINDGTPLGYLPYWGTGLDFEEIWLETANLRQGGTTGSAIDLYPWFTYWRAMYDLYKRGGFDVNPFLNTPWVLFSYFGVIDIYGHTFLSKDIIEYCDLLLYTSDYSVGYSGSNVDNVCTRSNLLDDYNSNLSGDNLNIGIDIIGSGENITDGTDFINKYWAVLRQNFSNAVENTDGVLPLYIQLALIGLILFRFISH